MWLRKRTAMFNENTLINHQLFQGDNSNLEVNFVLAQNEYIPLHEGMLAFQKPSLQCRMLVPSIVYFTSQAYSTLLPCEKSFPFRKIPFDVYPFLGLPWNLHFPSIAEMCFGKFVSCALS